MKEIQKKLKEILEERLARGNGSDEDFLGQVIKDKESQKFISEEFIIQLLFSMSFATFESISASLTLILILLADHPEVAKELEVRLERYEKLFNAIETMWLFINRWIYQREAKI